MQRRMRAFSKALRPWLVFIERGRVSPASSRRAIQESFAISRATTYRYTAGNGAASLTEMKHADRETTRQLHQTGLSPEKIASIRGKTVRALRAEGFDVAGLAWTIGGECRLLAPPAPTDDPMPPPSEGRQVQEQAASDQHESLKGWFRSRAPLERTW